MTDSIRACACILVLVRAEVVIGAGDEADDAGLLSAVQHRPVGRLSVAEGAAAGVHRGGEVGTGLVQVRHDDGARHAHRGALAPEERDGPIDVVGTRDDEDCRVGRPQARSELADEVGVAGGVEEVERDSVGVERGGGEGGRTHVPFDRRALPRDASRDESLEECRLASPAGSDEHDVADVLRRGGVGGRRKV